MSLYQAERTLRRARQLRHPARFVRNRLIAKALGALGLWRLLRAVFR